MLSPTIVASLLTRAADPIGPTIPMRTAMNSSDWIRRFHRWTSIVFTTTVAANFVAMTKGPPPAWITYSPLLPLLLLLLSGLYLFVLPYARTWLGVRRGRQAAHAQSMAAALPE